MENGDWIEIAVQAFKFDIRCISDDDDGEEDDGRSVRACMQSVRELGHFPVIIIIMLRDGPAANLFPGSAALGGHFGAKFNL